MSSWCGRHWPAVFHGDDPVAVLVHCLTTSRPPRQDTPPSRPSATAAARTGRSERNEWHPARNRGRIRAAGSKAAPMIHGDHRRYTRRAMNAPQDAAASGFSLGVLIIGSLLWDPERDAWRSRLRDVDEPHRVRVPIRYGRFSERRQSYTMVLSPDLDESCFGHAVAIQCKSQDIVEEAKCLWAAERKKDGDCGVSASWGCVGLLLNTDSKTLPAEQPSHWRDFVNECGERRSNYEALATAGAGVDQEGILTIDWPKLDAGPTLPFDALLATATKPRARGSGRPSPQDIAAEWKTTNGKQEVSYFWNNRKHRILTCQDDDIAKHLPDSDHAC